MYKNITNARILVMMNCANLLVHRRSCLLPKERCLLALHVHVQHNFYQQEIQLAVSICACVVSVCVCMVGNLVVQIFMVFADHPSTVKIKCHRNLH